MKINDILDRIRYISREVFKILNTKVKFSNNLASCFKFIVLQKVVYKNEEISAHR